MKCNYCGTENAEGSLFCTNCGASLQGGASAVNTNTDANVNATVNANAGYVNPAQNPQFVQNAQYGQPMQSAPVYNQYQQYGQYGQGVAPAAQMSKKDFLELPAMDKQKKNLKACYIICYVCAVVTLIAQVSAGTFPLDAIILAVLGAVIQFRKSFVAAVILLAYSILSLIVAIVAYHTVSGWLIILAGVYAVITTNKVNKAYKQYTRTGVLPVDMVA